MNRFRDANKGPVDRWFRPAFWETMIRVVIVEFLRWLLS